MIPWRYCRLLPAIPIVLTIVACGRRKLRPEELERNRAFAEIVYREAHRTLGNDDFFERSLLASPYPAVARWSAVALGRIGNRASLPWLYRAFHLPAADLRAAAAFAVGQIEDRETLKARGLEPNPDTRSELVRLLADSSPIVRMRAVEALGKAGQPADLPAVIECVRDTKIAVKPQRQVFLELAITALMRIDDPGALPLLRSLAVDQDPVIQWRAASALVPVYDKSARAVFQRLQENPDPDIRAWAEVPDEPAGLRSCREITADAPEGRGRAPSAPTMLTCSMLATARLDRTVAIVDTDRGSIEIELFREDAPVTASAFVRQAASGFFNGLTFMRVGPFFVIQGDDPRNRQGRSTGDTLQCEINMRSFRRGSVGMALADGDAGGNRFFIALSAQPHLDGNYTCFGRVISGMQVADRIVPGDVIRSIRIKNDVTMLDYRQY